MLAFPQHTSPFAVVRVTTINCLQVLSLILDDLKVRRLLDLIELVFNLVVYRVESVFRRIRIQSSFCLDVNADLFSHGDR